MPCQKKNEINHLLEENQKIKIEIGLFDKRIAVYENDYLKNLYDSHKNQSVTYLNRKGEKVQKGILLIPDVYEIIIN
jgi:endo-beta-N-acetylglucosaminidase D